MVSGIFIECYYIYIVFLGESSSSCRFGPRPWQFQNTITIPPNINGLPVLPILWGSVFPTVYGDDDLDDADWGLGLAVGEVLDVVCCGLSTVCVLVPVLVADGLKEHCRAAGWLF